MGGFSSFVRSVPLAVFGSAAARARELDDIDETVRVPLPLSRRVGFVQLAGGAGASSTTAYVANLLAQRRSGPVLGVDASRGPVGMLSYALPPPAQEPGTPVDAVGGLAAAADSAVQRSSIARATARRLGDAVDGLPRTTSGLWMLPLDAHLAGAPASAREWFDSCGPVTRFFDIVVTDWGVREPRIDLAQAASASHVLCLVSRADRHAAERAVSAIAAIRALDAAPAVVVCLVDVGRTAGPAPGIVASSAGCPVLTIPFDRVRSVDRSVTSAGLSNRTRLAYGRLARLLIAEAAASTTRSSARPTQSPAASAAREHGRRAASVPAEATG